MIGFLCSLIFLGLISQFNIALGSCDQYLELDRPGFSMEHVPVMDQDGLSMCRVYSATQMADAWRFSHGDRNFNRRTSPLATGLRQSKYDWFDFEPGTDNYGGYHCDIVNFMRSTGGCTMNASVESLGGKSPQVTLAYLGRFFERKSNNNRARAEQLHCALPRLGMPAGFLPSVQKITDLLAGDRDDFIRGVLTSRCEGPNRVLIPKAPRCVTASARFLSTSHNVAIINNLLDRPNPQPVSIGYCSEILTKGRAYRGPRFPGIGNSCRYHDSLVIGRRKNPRTGKCEFKVRNSWGSSCRAYSPDWQCQYGNIWIDADTIGQNTGEINSWAR